MRDYEALTYNIMPLVTWAFFRPGPSANLCWAISPLLPYTSSYTSHMMMWLRLQRTMWAAISAIVTFCSTSPTGASPVHFTRAYIWLTCTGVVLSTPTRGVFYGFAMCLSHIHVSTRYILCGLTIGLFLAITNTVWMHRQARHRGGK